MIARPVIRVRRARFASVLSCGHHATVGAMIVSRRPGRWICGGCALKLALDTIAARQATHPHATAAGTASR
jgi:hypothetical protein